MVSGKGKLSEIAIQRVRTLMLNEDIAYKGAFLTSVREKLLPYYKNGNIASLDPEEEENMIKEIYNEVNDLFIDEHWMMSNGDLLEQCFNMINPIRKIW